MERLREQDRNLSCGKPLFDTAYHIYVTTLQVATLNRAGNSLNTNHMSLGGNRDKNSKGIDVEVITKPSQEMHVPLTEFLAATAHPIKHGGGT